MSLTKVSYSMIRGAPVNVLDYGAVGNNVADDSDAIQDAINSGHEVFIPNGTYKITKTISLSPYVNVLGESTSGVVINNTNNAVFAFDYLPPTGNDINSGMVFAYMTINSKFGIRIGRSDGSFSAQAAVKNLHFHNLNITGTYVNEPTVPGGTDANAYTSVTASPAEMEGYGIGIQLSKVLDSKVELCKIEYLGVGVFLYGSDINTVELNRLNKNGWHLQYFGLDTWGGQSKFKDNDCLYNVRPGGVYLYNCIWATIEDNYFENYYASATFIISQFDSCTRIVGNRFDTPSLAQVNPTVPIMDLAPYLGSIVTENRGTLTIVQPVVFRGTSYDPNRKSPSKWYGNQIGFPEPNYPFVFNAPEINNQKFAYNNFINFGGGAASIFPFVISPASSRFVLNTSVANADIKLGLTPGAKFYRIDYTGRYVTGTGYRSISHISPSGTVTSLGIAGYLGFPASGDVVTISETVAIPDALSLAGYFEITLINTEVEYESVIMSVTDTLIADATPTGGTVTYQAGMMIQKLTPVVGQPKGWMCTVTGAPGTWVSEGNL